MRATASPSSTSRCSGQFPYANCPAVPPEMVLLPRWFYYQHLRHVELDADHRRAAEHHVGPQAGAQLARAIAASANSSSTRPKRRDWACTPPKQRLLSGPISSSRPIGSGKRSSGSRPFRRRAIQQGRRLDARALRGLRRRRRDLPADDLHRHRPATASACRTTTPNSSGR